MNSMKPVGLAVLAIALAACGGNVGIAIDEAWGRASPSTAEAAAFYMRIDNPTDTGDTLVGADAEPCGAVELHESSMNADGVMSMAQVAGGIAIPAGDVVLLEPGGLHIMCIGLDHELVEGEVVPVDLEFASGESRSIDVQIRSG